MAENKKNKKPKTESGTPAGTGTKSTGAPDLTALVAAAAAAGMGGAQGPKGPVFTTQDANAYVQSVYQQLLGRNAVGAERSKAIKAFLSQSQDTDVTGRTEVITGMVQQTPEFRRRQENRYLDAIYSEVLNDVRRAQA